MDSILIILLVLLLVGVLAILYLNLKSKPKDENKDVEEISNLNSELGLKDLSMGMSSDYEKAIKFKATFLRIGSGILGPRNFKK